MLPRLWNCESPSATACNLHSSVSLARGSHGGRCKCIVVIVSPLGAHARCSRGIHGKWTQVTQIFVSQHHSSGLPCYLLFILSAKSSSGALQGTMTWTVALLLVSFTGSDSLQRLIEHAHICTQSTPSINA